MIANGLMIVQRIDSLLKGKNENRNILAKIININPQNISAWSIRGTIPAADIAIKIADYLGVSVRWLITGEEDKELSEEDRKILSLWHELSEEDRKAIECMIEYKVSAYQKNNVQADNVG